MGVLDGQPVNQAITNPAFINKNVNDVMPNTLGFNRVASGASLADIQATANKLYTATGASESQTGTVYNATPNTITNGDPYQTALTKLANKFDPATGHNHDGTAGMGPILSGSSISDVPFMGFFEPGSTVTGATGTSTNVSSLMVGKFASSNDTTLGVVVDNGHNKLRILAASGSDAFHEIEDPFGNLVYGRITASAATGGIWTLSYFSEQSGVETPYSFAATGGTDLLWWYQELFNPVLSTSVYNPTMEMFAPASGGGAGGVTTLSASGGTPLTGNVTLSAGTNVTLFESGQDIEISAGSSTPTSIKTSNYSIQSSDGLVQGDSSGGTFAFTFPTPATGQVVEVIKVDSSLTPITFVAGPSTGQLSTPGEYRKYVYSGTAWLLTAWNSDASLTPYTSTTQGFGTITGEISQYTRNGPNLRVIGQFTTGIVSAVEAQFGLPGSLTVHSSLTTLQLVGHWVRDAGGAQFDSMPVIALATNTYINLGGWINGGVPSSQSPYVPQNVNILLNTSEYQSFWFEVPIEGWES